MTGLKPDIDIAIDRGGTFCDVIARIDGQKDIIFKLLSVDPQNYHDAPTEAIRRILEVAESRAITRGELLDASRIASCRIGTTIATNALLEQKGEKFALATTKGFRDVCVIGDQTRPKLFALDVRKAEALHHEVIEIDERATVEDYDLDPFPTDKAAELTDPALIRTASGEIIRIIKPVDVNRTREQLHTLRKQGYSSLAICFMHSYLFPDHERIVADLAREEQFKYVTTSADTAPTIKYLRRSTSVCSEAYLYPIIQAYVQDFQSGFKVPPRRVDFMCSDGGLRQAEKYRGNEALLSGPAGGIVGIVQTCYDEEEGTPVIGFDMGGTSTDISRYDGRYDYLDETTLAGRVVSAHMLNIVTVAAGGGSILSTRNGLLVVGPESAGAHPGPACYRKGGPLTVTDANLFLGRLVPSSFPAIFGENADQPLDTEIVKKIFENLTNGMNKQASKQYTPEELALGFIQVANTTMSRPIRNATEARGFAPDKHNLASFGGAGGQHACAIADNLGIKQVLIHKHSSLLSAYGIAHARLQYELSEPFVGNYSRAIIHTINVVVDRLKAKVRSELLAQGAFDASITFDESLSLRYFGTDTNISISKPEDEDYAKAFEVTHLREFAFKMSRQVVVDAVSVRGTGSSGIPAAKEAPFSELKHSQSSIAVSGNVARQKSFINGSWVDIPIYQLEGTLECRFLEGPALIIDNTQTIFVEPGFRAHLLSNHVVLTKSDSNQMVQPLPANHIDPIQLSVFAHRFMGIAEQMGNTLQRTSISTSIRERLDFSCAIFAPDGKLVANAPHIPIHLGSMQFAIRYQHELWHGKLERGDVLLTNHPEAGGTHLPDLTGVTPVFAEDGQLAFYVASRGHHSDIGGKGITAMMPDSKELWEEGLSVKSMKIVSQGEFLENDVRAAFEHAGSFPGCSPTRRIQDNISDLKAMISANQRGMLLLSNLCNEFTLPVVHQYMGGIQTNAEAAVRKFLIEVAREHPEPLRAVDWFDDGTPIAVTITINPETGDAVYDFTGTGTQIWGNYNCPISVTHSSVIYTLRCLIDLDIPLNEGCLAPVDIQIPKGSILRPNSNAAICGSTLASQRIIDVILRAYGRVAASQGCANSFGWGMGGRDLATGKITPGWNYGESLGGGTGAGPNWHGEHVTQCHSTNTKNTDPEVIEKRTPVVVRQYAINRGSGGRGRFNGGDGCVREIEARRELKFSILSDRRVYKPYGLCGGGDGRSGENYVFKWNEDHTDLDKINIGGKAALILQAGEVMQINTPGGGGWGLPNTL
ncbi:uncharacterized protein K452DRAFT_322389 [Aplosporella prunicola CBS 121167]|uniref:5-oxoprolinase n=1 Tax=Aplosporella prunicola CBS 121167 TaxID=1176127 RepID=A0A6A6AZR6_9PEZI|nr:uncharacterized protein K452DRAFT_322389 [Aplosporella prunicola CBS 121167]KAF2136504.1 hypothetical protein K452DRAFT_322389 [Aplosporella prunicola CBS 121167]